MRSLELGSPSLVVADSAIAARLASHRHSSSSSGAFSKQHPPATLEPAMSSYDLPASDLDESMVPDVSPPAASCRHSRSRFACLAAAGRWPLLMRPCSRSLARSSCPTCSGLVQGAPAALISGAHGGSKSRRSEVNNSLTAVLIRQLKHAVYEPYTTKFTVNGKHVAHVEIVALAKQVTYFPSDNTSEEGESERASG